MLGVRDPKLAISGNITCSASIQYRVAVDGKMGDLATNSQSFSRNLIILGKFLQNPAGTIRVFAVTIFVWRSSIFSHQRS